MGDNNHWPEIYPKRMAVWRQRRGGSEPYDAVNNKILCALHNVKSFPLKRIMIQFWRPVKTSSGKRLLSCSFNPYAVSGLNRRLCKYYRSSCCKYFYTISDRGVVLDDPMTITGAPPSTAILSLFPEVVLDLTPHRGIPLVDIALECDLTCFMMLPAFSVTGCVGVIEVSARYPCHLLVIYNELQRELEKNGLNFTPPPSLWKPCKALTGDWQLAVSEIQQALQVAVESHAITLAQVWTPF
ncbi:hypothetical protein M8C21_006153 [Ambrosia artemisiifolia]|uniref:Uncharacterized protein n=1 Tax=Ambrosia artemisiifolia TaxID=4212 RepID=A0AAD5CTQ5_AMBAR|nr:hypothetical protein M8C21_006153 [Ambrosia artemisiifolia]